MDETATTYEDLAWEHILSQVENSHSYTWDANGNLLFDGESYYQYDLASRLVSVSGPSSTVGYAYNGLGDRLQQTVDGATMTYTLDLNTGLTQVLTDGEITYLYGIARLAQESDGYSEYYLGDALGSVRQLIEGSGAVTYAASYTPYGEVLSSTGEGESEFGFTGEQVDVTGLVYLRARYYSPWDGRFLTRDTWEGNSSSPMSYNMWLYVYGNPILYTDPSGNQIGEAALLYLAQELVVTAVGFAAGGAIGFAFGYCTYESALAGECGCEMRETALYLTKLEWMQAYALSGGIIGGIAGALAASSPLGMIVVGGAGLVVAATDYVKTVQIIAFETGLTGCTIARLLLDVVTAIFGYAGIKGGVEAWFASGHGLKWAWLNTPASSTLYSADMSGLYGASAEEIRAIIPSDWEVSYLPRVMKTGNTYYEQWVFTSPDGIEQVRIHQPLLGDPNGPWQVRWGVRDVGQIPTQYKVYESPPNPFSPDSWLYFDKYGRAVSYQSDAAHQGFVVDVTLSSMRRVFGTEP